MQVRRDSGMTLIRDSESPGGAALLLAVAVPACPRPRARAPAESGQLAGRDPIALRQRGDRRPHCRLAFDLDADGLLVGMRQDHVRLSREESDRRARAGPGPG